MDKQYLIYKITNLINNKIYIGCHITKNLHDGYLGSSVILKKAIEKYGIENFEKIILHTFDNPVDMLYKEAELVNEDFINRSDTYNINLGGGSFYYINKHKLNNKVNQHLSVKKNLENLEYRIDFSRKVSEGLKNSNFKFDSFLGKKHKEESKRKIGAANSIHQKGSGNSQYGTCWITKDSLNKKIKKEELDDYILMGWATGRKI